MHHQHMAHKATGAITGSRAMVMELLRRARMDPRVMLMGVLWGISGSPLPVPSSPLPGQVAHMQAMGRARQGTVRALTQGMGRPQLARSEVLMPMEAIKARYATPSLSSVYKLLHALHPTLGHCLAFS